MWSSTHVSKHGRCSRAACLLNMFRCVCWSFHWYWLPRRKLLFRQLTNECCCPCVLLLSDLPDLPGTSAKLGRQPSAFAKRLQQTVRSDDCQRALVGHIAHAAKTGHCHSPVLMVLACRFWLHTYFHTYITLHYITLRYVTLRYITLHYINIHTYITYIHTYIYTYMHT